VKVLYFLLRSAGFLVASLPLFILYKISTALSWLTGVVFRYRRDVVEQNLRLSFPDKDNKWIRKQTRLFYMHFVDVMVESFKLLALNKNLLPKRVTVTNPEFLEKLHQQGRGVIAVGGHYGNWEWMGTALQLLSPYQALVAYKPLSNKLIDRVMLRIRSLHGSKLIPMNQIYRAVKTSNVPTITLLVADQAPHPENAYWTTFMHQDTPVFMGPEKIAKSTGHVVVFLAMTRPRRGEYTITVKEVSLDPINEPNFAITEKHLQLLTEEILIHPSCWLWSHKRWKHKRPA
jgi:Kdo2-lipid IVA lauroyltransferase/acyltransferase